MTESEPWADPAEPGGLAAELERLKRRNAELTAQLHAANAGRRVPHFALNGRSIGAALLAVLAVLLVFASVPTTWMRAQVLDTDRYVATVAPLGTDPVLQDEVAGRVANAINEHLDVESWAREYLPPVAQPLAGPIAQGVRQLISQAAAKFTHSEQFARLWVTVNRAAHQQVVAILTGQTTSGGVRVDSQGRVYLDLGPVIDEVKQRLAALGLGLVSRIPPVSLVIQVGQISGVEKARTLVHWLDVAGNWLPWLALLCLLAAVALARDRRRMLLGIGTGIFVAMLVLRVGLALVRNAGLNAIAPDALSPQLAAHVFDQVTGSLRAGGRAVAAAGLLVALAALSAGPGAGATKVRSAAVSAVRWVRRLDRSGTVGGWIGRHRVALRLAVGVLAGLTVLFWVRPTGAVLLGIAVVSGVLLALIEALAAPRYQNPQ